MVLLPGREAGRGLGGRDPRRDRRGQPADVRARLLDPLRRDRAAARGRRRHGRAEGSGAPRPAPVRGGQGRALPDGYRAGRDRERASSCSPTRADRRRSRRDHRDHVQGRGETDLFGEQSVLCGGATGAGAGGVRDPRRGRVRPAPRLLRDAARAEADRRPHVREGRPGGCATRSEHRRVRRHDPRPEGHRPRGPGGDEAGPRGHPVGRVREGGSPRTAREPRTSTGCATRRPDTRSSRSGRTCAR